MSAEENKQIDDVADCEKDRRDGLLRIYVGGKEEGTRLTASVGKKKIYLHQHDCCWLL